LYIVVLQRCARTCMNGRRFYNLLTSRIPNTKLCYCNFRLQVVSADPNPSFRSHRIIPCFMSCVIPSGVPVFHSTRNVITVHFNTCNKTVYSFFDGNTIAIYESCNMRRTNIIRFCIEQIANNVVRLSIHISQNIFNCS